MKRLKIDLEGAFEQIHNDSLEKKKIAAENLNLDYIVLFQKDVATEILTQLEDTVEYLSGDLSKVKVFGKWHEIPRQQAAYGEAGTMYRFSGTTIPSKPWTPLLILIKDVVRKITGFDYNFVLINKYRNGTDHIGEHKDNEIELDENTPIASLSFGQTRTFVLKHQDVRRTGTAKRDVPRVKVELQHGSLLLMNPPTNRFWYHSLPAKKSAPGVRINLTFRKIVK